MDYQIYCVYLYRASELVFKLHFYKGSKRRFNLNDEISLHHTLRKSPRSHTLIYLLINTDPPVPTFVLTLPFI